MVRGRRPLRLRADHTRGVSRGLRRRPHRRLHPPLGTLPRHLLPPSLLPPLPHPRRPLPPRQLTPSCFSFYTIRRSRSADFSPPKSRRGNLPAVVRIGCANSGTTGTGQKCQKTNFFRFLNICAPKPHQRWVPRSAPSPFVPIRSLLSDVNEQLDKAYLSTPNTLSETELRKLRASVFEHAVSHSKTVSRAAHPSVHRRCNRLLNAAAR